MCEQPFLEGTHERAMVQLGERLDVLASAGSEEAV